MPKLIKVVTISVAAVVVSGGSFVAGQLAPKLPLVAGWTRPAGPGLDYASLQDLQAKLAGKFDGPIDEAKFLDGAKAGLVASLGDPYTVYLNAQAAKELEDDLAGTLQGIGAEIGLRGNNITVVAPIADAPADRAGLKAGDIVLKIDDADTQGWTVEQAVAKIRGPDRTQVKLQLYRPGKAPFEINITRAVITVPSVKWSLKNNRIGYIQITRFGNDTIDKMDQAARELSGQGADKFILDLRNDPGGYLEGAVKVASQFLRPDLLVVEERKGDKSIEKLTARAGGRLVGRPAVVLINGGSASASEIVAGALQDHQVARVVGEKSFGKGSVQDLVKLGGGAELKVTIAHWFTPGGKNIGKEGIKPDVEVKLTEAARDQNKDPQLDKALELLK